LAGGKTESGLKIGEQDFAVGVGLDRLEDLFIDGDLVFLADLGDLVSLSLLGEDVTFSLLRAALTVATEIFVVDVLGHLDIINVQLRTGGNDKVLVDTPDGDTVDLVWTSDSQEARLKGLEEDNSLSTVLTSQNNQDGAWLKGLAYLGSTNMFLDLVDSSGTKAQTKI